jgi:hypothetical protein
MRCQSWGNDPHAGLQFYLGIWLGANFVLNLEGFDDAACSYNNLQELAKARF